MYIKTCIRKETNLSTIFHPQIPDVGDEGKSEQKLKLS